MGSKLYKVSAYNDDQYGIDFEPFICTEEALNQYIDNIKKIAKNPPEGFFSHGGKPEDIKFKKNSIEFPSYGSITLTWEEYKGEKIVTEVSEIYEAGFNSCGYDDTFLYLECEFKYDKNES